MNSSDLNLYWKTVVDTIQDGVMIVSPEGTIVSVNKGFETITGYSQSEVLGQSCALLGCSSCEIARNAEGCHWCVMFKHGRLRRQRCALIRKDGIPVQIVKNASVLKDGEGQIIGAVETITDITDLTTKESLIASYRQELDAQDRFYGMIGASAPMQALFELIRNAGQSDAPVIIFGESGAGKELIAKAIHEAGSRSQFPYIKVNCAALNESLLESELFGHVKGSFTGAHRDREGRFEAADKGDIFLDEIGDLPLSTQVKLLRVLEEKVVERVGDHKPIQVDVRIISATNRDLQALISKGEFREDFFYRINVIPLRAPSLRERKGDIPLLARSFFNRIRMKSGKDIHGISREAMDALANYNWPGNVRELKSALEFAFVSCHEDLIEPRHLPAPIAAEPDCAPPQPVPVQSRGPGGATLDQVKRTRLIDALTSAKGNQSEAARILGISRTSVWAQVKRYQLNPADYV
ncbi:PAS modulated sigma54 specific transcriptional regulator, Fis family [Desulfatibacillum aliphaticivorans]|uniref:PAS modulated sigma54 specific transcriptional regulator, Fis family n=1 Tax=Desulfatibacillum aliphaticivorans TaxID=218208 RepID=B8FM80_DESAL|nr:sigma-54-dependent Fis family transcriptional regulator [Desulfatibacillum aliphaticivorans]ACL05918.1 PAS modulated sigma54 specific transcriptional regulator, Fis family [Desulfatibacillum aliphaticivorans]